METDVSWTGTGIDLDRPNAARMYDYYLGGAFNFAADRELADKALQVMPWMRQAVSANRSFLGRAVRYCVQQGIRQFVDLGSGIPTVGNVHEIAQHAAADCRVAYVDNEPVAVAHSRHLLAANPLATVTHADLRDPAAVLAEPTVRELIDFTAPVAVLAVAVLHFIPDEQRPEEILAAYRSVLVPGSHVVISHVTDDHDPVQARAATRVYQQANTPVLTRTRAQLEAMSAGMTLVEPGLVDATEWRGEPSIGGEHAGFYAAVGRIE
ncbi:SAM-dependent methyltransferase [Actinoalloteichus hymeniacidonis]|uniref:S-adenosyl methyltransferase n=1 Tax=Actinoalloteichus hymeniacidonis TaxID=340345 RepID=A0AAC9HQG2_9PSEU|nr:SAM-dependent methyltransferase [Actinoalloteichus hymeniacidonis]AOS63443.1 S-adenosyl methyltransferase [Actinoalloteichus hymeniacidonis]MBB5908515.1 SAM-dependent methyltransferase [Actinoalloteichus hymeniacidonis]